MRQRLRAPAGNAQSAPVIRLSNDKKCEQDAKQEQCTKNTIHDPQEKEMQSLQDQGPVIATVEVHKLECPLLYGSPANKELRSIALILAKVEKAGLGIAHED